MMACPVLSDPFWKLIQVDRNTVEKEIEEASNKKFKHSRGENDPLMLNGKIPVIMTTVNRDNAISSVGHGTNSASPLKIGINKDVSIGMTDDKTTKIDLKKSTKNDADLLRDVDPSIAKEFNDDLDLESLKDFEMDETSKQTDVQPRSVTVDDKSPAADASVSSTTQAIFSWKKSLPTKSRTVAVHGVLNQGPITLLWNDEKSAYRSTQLTVPCGLYKAELEVEGQRIPIDPIDIKFYTFEIDLFIVEEYEDRALRAAEQEKSRREKNEREKQRKESQQKPREQDYSAEPKRDQQQKHKSKQSVVSEKNADFGSKNTRSRARDCESNSSSSGSRKNSANLQKSKRLAQSCADLQVETEVDMYRKEGYIMSDLDNAADISTLSESSVASFSRLKAYEKLVRQQMGGLNGNDDLPNYQPTARRRNDVDDRHVPSYDRYQSATRDGRDDYHRISSSSATQAVVPDLNGDALKYSANEEADHSWRKQYSSPLRSSSPDRGREQHRDVSPDRGRSVVTDDNRSSTLSSRRFSSPQRGSIGDKETTGAVNGDYNFDRDDVRDSRYANSKYERRAPQLDSPPQRESVGSRYNSLPRESTRRHLDQTASQLNDSSRKYGSTRNLNDDSARGAPVDQLTRYKPDYLSSSPSRGGTEQRQRQQHIESVNDLDSERRRPSNYSAKKKKVPTAPLR